LAAAVAFVRAADVAVPGRRNDSLDLFDFKSDDRDCINLDKAARVGRKAPRPVLGGLHHDFRLEKEVA
jgi:hypothetical protein